MCYHLSTKIELQKERSRYWNDPATHELFMKELDSALLQDYYFANGFAHPYMLIYTNSAPFKPIAASWGLIPYWVKDQNKAKSIRKSTLNARGETMFEKPSFRHSARAQRCLIYAQGFFEHHHYKGKTYPFFISRKDKKPVILGGLWSEWGTNTTLYQNSLKTFSIVTTKANELMAKIHNNPKLSEPRMPVILEEEQTNDWLNDIDQIPNLLKSFPDKQLFAYTINKSGGNSPDVLKKAAYPELNLFF